MASPGFTVRSLDEIPSMPDQPFVEGEWKPVRAELGITAFGTNAYVADAGQIVIEEHDELGNVDAPDQQELYFVHRGRARFTVAGEDFEAPAGTYVFLSDPALKRKAVALEDGTAVLAVGHAAGSFTPSRWERRFTGG